MPSSGQPHEPRRGAGRGLALDDIETYVDLELAASAPLVRYIYGDLVRAREIHLELVRAGEGEFAAPHGRLVRTEDGRAVAMYTAPFTGNELSQVRLKNTRALMRLDAFKADPKNRERMSASRALFVTPGEGDAYLSRIAVAETLRGRRLGERVFGLFKAECEKINARQIVLEVAEEHAGALALYRRLGFRELARKSVDGDSGPALTYVHLGLGL